MNSPVRFSKRHRHGRISRNAIAVRNAVRQYSKAKSVHERRWWLDVIEPSRLRDEIHTHVRRLASEIGERSVFRPNALAAAREYIAAEFSRYGYSVRYQWYDADDLPCANLEATRHGQRWPGKILLLGAHYDTASGSPGANDNASGIAALLAIARRFAALSPAITVRFVAFVNEEPPFFASGEQGSIVYAAAARAKGDDIRLMVSLETIGYYRDTPGSQTYPAPFGLFYPKHANFLGFVSDFRSALLMHRCARAFRRVSKFPLVCASVPRGVPGASSSDHLAFWRCAYRAFMITDTAFYRYPYYHTAEDTAEKLDYPRLSEVVAALVRTFAAFAHADPILILPGS
jgi:hypothetical protein